MYVVSVFDQAAERNLVADEVFLTESSLVVVTSGERFEYLATDLIEIIPVSKKIGRDAINAERSLN